MNTLVVGGLRLEPQVAAHAAAMFEVLSDPAIYEFENRPPASREWLEDRYRRLETRRSADGSEQWLNWVVRLADGRLAGYVQATVRRDGLALVACELASRHWRRGIATAAVGAMLRELAATYGVSVCAAVLKARNVRSRALLQRLAFDDQPLPGVAPVEVEGDEVAMYRACDGGAAGI